MPKWKKDGIFLHPLFEFNCKGCRDPLATFTETAFILTNFPIYNDKPEEYNSNALDRTFVCDMCGFRLVFGLAVSEKHSEQIKEWDKSRRQDEPKEEEKSILWTP